MWSIRRSLTAYLLVLLAATLGVVGVVIDQLTGRVLEARERAAVELAESRYQDRVRDERQRVDDNLLAQARTLGDVMQTQYWVRVPQEFAKFRAGYLIAQLGGGQSPLFGAGYTAGFWHFPQPPQPPSQWAYPSATFGSLIQHHFATNLHIDPGYLKHIDEEDRSSDYFQINTLTGRIWRSLSLETHTLPFDPKPFDHGTLVEWRYSDVQLGPNSPVIRRVVLKIPLFTGQGFPSRPPRMRGPERERGPGPDRDRDRGPPPDRNPSDRSGRAPPAPPTPTQILEAVPKLYVQCGRPLSAIERRLDMFSDDRDEDLAKIRAEISSERITLRTRIAGIGVLAFLIAAVGGPLLVGRGLSPVEKLSDAVSHVSEKDFRLPHDGRLLPAELAPIHARLTQTLDLLRRAFAREKQAVADISHELRTPIASLLATIDVSLRKPRTPEQYRTTLEDCRSIARQLGRLVERIMTLASFDAGSVQTAVALIDADELATACGAVIRPLAEAHGLTFALQSEGPVDLETDPDKLREVLINLLHNAVEYNRPGGKVSLHVRKDNQSVVFEVQDTGIGMSPEVQEKIFERFYRADSSRHSTGVHAGLGLAIVKEYMGRLNGAITVESRPDVGSTFRVTLPVAMAESELLAESDSASQPTEHSRSSPRARGEAAPTGS